MGGMAGTGAGPTDCEYPAGPYGVAQGDIVPPTLTWQALAPGQDSPSTLTMADLHDCDGTHGIDAIEVDTKQFF